MVSMVRLKVMLFCIRALLLLYFNRSYRGKIKGLDCIQWKEPSDRHTWNDNYLCGTDKEGMNTYYILWITTTIIFVLSFSSCPLNNGLLNLIMMCMYISSRDLLPTEPEPEPTVSPDCRDDWPECKKHPEMCEDEEIASLVCQRTCKRCK